MGNNLLSAKATLPAYDRNNLAPRIIRLGFGAFHRAHQGVYADILAAEHNSDWGYCEVNLIGGEQQIIGVGRDITEVQRAEEALQLSGRSLPELIKKVVAKVAQGGGQCEEVLAAVDDRQQTVAPDTPFAASGAAADRLYADLGIATSPVSDDRDWDTIYSEAMDERYRQKGMIL